MQTDKHDQQLRQVIKQAPGMAVNAIKRIQQLIRLAKKLALLAKGILIALKAVLLFLLGGGWVLLLILLFVVLIYAVLMSPVTMKKELEASTEKGEYTGKVMSFFLDVTDEWNEELDAAAMNQYKSFENKCLEGLDEFQTTQAAQYALPYSLIMAIERVHLFNFDDLSDGWFPEPEIIYEELKTNYTWKDSEINYRAVYTYSYNYSYRWDEWIPPVFDKSGNQLSEGYIQTHFESRNAKNVAVTLNFPFQVKLLTQADAFDNVYVHEYEDYTTVENIASGSQSFSSSGNEYTVLNDSLENKNDCHAGMFLPGELSEEVSKHAQSVRDEIRNNFHPDAYDISFEFSFDIKESSKYYQPLKSITTQGIQFERLSTVLEEKLGYKIDPLDLEIIFHIATEYDENFAYNFAANNHGYAYFSIPQIFYDGLLGELAWPVSDHDTYITSKFGYRNTVRDSTGRIVSNAGFHGGVDIASGGRKIPVHSASSGIVIFAGMNGSLTKGYGRTVIIDHGFKENQRVLTLYAHLDSISVRAGQEIETGEIIGNMGKTGSSSGIHLHFEIIINNKKVDPLQFFPNKK